MAVTKETSDRIHLVLKPHLMKAFRDMADKNCRSISGQLAFMVEEEINRQRLPLQSLPLSQPSANRENASHLPNP